MPSIAVVEETRSVEVFSLDVVHSEVVNMDGDLSFLDSAPRETAHDPFFDTFERLRPILSLPKR
jgi:hypothetical protein